MEQGLFIGETESCGELLSRRIQKWGAGMACSNIGMVGMKNTGNVPELPHQLDDAGPWGPRSEVVQGREIDDRNRLEIEAGQI